MFQLYRGAGHRPTACVAWPLDIGTLEAGEKTNMKSGKVKFFLFSLYSTFCWQVKFCDIDS